MGTMKNRKGQVKEEKVDLDNVFYAFYKDKSLFIIKKSDLDG